MQNGHYDKAVKMTVAAGRHTQALEMAMQHEGVGGGRVGASVWRYVAVAAGRCRRVCVHVCAQCLLMLSSCVAASVCVCAVPIDAVLKNGLLGVCMQCPLTRRWQRR